MSKLRPDYQFKFFDDGNYSVFKGIMLDHSTHDVMECLKSEGVNLIDHDSIFKMIDIYLRIVGIHRESSDAEYVTHIHSVIGTVQFRTFDSTDERNEQIKNLLDLFQDVVDTEYKFNEADLEVIKNNVSTVINEIVIYLNDMINILVDEYSNQHVSSVHLTYMSKYDKDISFDALISYHSNIGVHAIDIASTMFRKVDENEQDNVAISAFTFTKPELDKINEHLKLDDDKNEEVKTDGSKEADENQECIVS